MQQDFLSFSASYPAAEKAVQGILIRDMRHSLTAMMAEWKTSRAVFAPILPGTAASASGLSAEVAPSHAERPAGQEPPEAAALVASAAAEPSPPKLEVKEEKDELEEKEELDKNILADLEAKDWDGDIPMTTEPAAVSAPSGAAPPAAPHEPQEVKPPEAMDPAPDSASPAAVLAPSGTGPLAAAPPAAAPALAGPDQTSEAASAPAEGQGDEEMDDAAEPPGEAPADILPPILDADADADAQLSPTLQTAPLYFHRSVPLRSLTSPSVLANNSRSLFT